MKAINNGFTTIELLVAIIVGVILVSSAYQLHSNVNSTAKNSQEKSRASSSAYDILRKSQTDPSLVSTPCSTHTSQPEVPSYAKLPSASASVVVTCPYGTSSSLSLITVSIKYQSNGQEQQVYRAITIRK